MSIYGSLPAPDDSEHSDSCARWDKRDPGIWEISNRPCDCGQPDAPLVYRGSHILPSENDARGGWVDIACINGHITRDARDEGDHDGPPHPFLRFGVNNETVVLLPRHVEQIRDTLTWWLRAIEVGLVAANEEVPIP